MCGVDAAADRAPLPAGQPEAPGSDRPGCRRVDGTERRVLRHALDRGGALLRQGTGGGNPRVALGANAGRPARRNQFRVGRRDRVQGVCRTGRGVRRPVDEARGRDRRRRRLAAAGAAPHAPRAAFVGRDEERSLVERSRNAVRAGAQRVVLVSGEPGIGKSRLSSLAAHGAHGEGFAVLVGRVLRGADGAVRAVDRRVLATRRARPDRAPRAARRAAWRRACSPRSRPASPAARDAGTGEL